MAITNIRKISLVLALMICLSRVSATTPEQINSPGNTVSCQEVQRKALQMQPEALNLLQNLVSISSSSSNESGLDKVLGIIANELKKQGAILNKHVAIGAKGSNLVAHFVGSGKAKIILMAHMDTINSNEVNGKTPFIIKQGRVYGTGAADAKGGIVIALSALKLLHQLNYRKYGRITLLLNSNEETGSYGSRALIKELAQQHDVALNLEPGRPGDGLVVWRKGAATAIVDVKGQAAHAGVAPESGHNAAMELAHQILQMANLGNAEKHTTVNFTVLHAGMAKNVIPDTASAMADVRVADPAEFERLFQEMQVMAHSNLIPGTQVKVTLKRGLPAMPKNSQTDTLAATAQAIYAELGLKLQLEGTGGASDAGLTFAAGLPTLDGLGIVGGNIHTPEEFAEINSIAPRTYLLTRLIMELSLAHSGWRH